MSLKSTQRKKNICFQCLMDSNMMESSTNVSSVVFTSLLGLVVGFLVYFCAPYWRLRKLPGPPANFLLGHLPLMVKHGHQVFNVLAKEYGPIFKIRLGRQPIVIIATAQLCEEVSVKKFKSFPNRGLPSSVTASSFLSKGLFNMRDKRWSAMKNVVLSLYQPTALAGLIPTMQSHIVSTTRQISKIQKDVDQDVHFSDLNLKMSMEVIGNTAFGVDFGLLTSEEEEVDRETKRDDDVSKFMESHEYSTYSIKMHLKASFSIVIGLLVPILEVPVRELFKRVPGTSDYKMYHANRNLAERVGKIIATKERELDRGSNDFVSAILRARECDRPTRELFTSDYISSLVYEHLIAGSSSTAFTLSTVLYAVSQHPEVERKLLREIDGFGPHDVVPNPDELRHKFPYIDQVIKESMRYYTGSPLIARESSKQIELGGYVLPKGTWVWMAVDFLAKDPNNFPEPEVYRPERFDPDCDEQKQRHPYCLMPFGIGPRACMGQRFALQEIKLAIIHLYRKFTFMPSPNMESPAEFEYGGILVHFKHGLKLRAATRTTVDD